MHNARRGLNPTILILFGSIVSPLLAADELKVSDRAALIHALQNAKPGATVLLEPGNYEGGLEFTGLRGSGERPFVLAGADPKRPPTIHGGASGIHLRDPVHLELRDLVFEGSTGNALNIDDGGSFDSPAQHVALKRLVVRGPSAAGNRDGIKLSGVVDFRVEDSSVERWGRGGSAIDMVGCHRGLIAGCSFRHEGADGANGVQAKGGSREITIRRCRFEDAGGRAINIGGSTGRPYFRPRPEGFEAKDITVEDNVFIASQAPIAFVGVDGATVRWNTLYRPRRWALRILQETRDAEFAPCRGGIFERNVIVFRSDELRQAINIGAGTSPETFRFAANHWYCLDRPTESARFGRQLPTPEKDGVYGQDPRLRDAERGDFRLAPGGPPRSAGARLEN